MTIYDTFMFRNELDMLECRLEELDGMVTRHVLVEAPVTHRGFYKSLVFMENKQKFGHWPVTSVTAGSMPVLDDWGCERYQRDCAWPVINAIADDEDWVLICDVDEIPSAEVLSKLCTMTVDTVAVYLRTCAFAVDWECTGSLPPTCVAARVSYLRAGRSLSGVRAGRGGYQSLSGGWHFSWIGGPAAQREKLETATCHVEIMSTPEARLIMDGTRYRTAEDGGGLTVRPVDVDQSWPRYIYERRCPELWFRPRK